MCDKLIHMYCGDGKGKTTAAIGLAIRAAGAGKRVLFTQFMKGDKTGELNSLQKLDNITVLRSDKLFPFYSQMTSEQKDELTDIHNQILDTIIETIQAGKCDMVILDEITYPYHWKLIDCEKFCDFIKQFKSKVEIVCTGREPDTIFMESADYITEMKCIRHPFEKGIPAREGIEY